MVSVLPGASGTRWIERSQPGKCSLLALALRSVRKLPRPWCKVVAAEPPDLTLNAALLVRTLDPRFAVERVEAAMRAQSTRCRSSTRLPPNSTFVTEEVRLPYRICRVGMPPIVSNASI